MESPPLDARTREQFPRFFWDLGLRRGAEIGVFDGSYLVEFCKQGFEMIGVDLWEPYPGYDDYKRARTLHKISA